MGKTISEIRAHNKSVGGHFFDKGYPPVLVKKGNKLVTRVYGGGYIVYEYNPQTGKINFVNNPTGKYSTEPYKTKKDAMKSIR